MCIDTIVSMVVLVCVMNSIACLMMGMLMIDDVITTDSAFYYTLPIMMDCMMCCDDNGHGQ